MKIILFGLLLALAFPAVEAAERSSFDLVSMKDPDAQISIFSFDGYSIVENSRHGARGRQSLEYSVHIAPPLTSKSRARLNCLDPHSSSNSPHSCSPALPDQEPDFSTCSDTIGPGTSGSCVEVWDMGSFLVVATYSRLGILEEIEIEEQDEDEENEGE